VIALNSNEYHLKLRKDHDLGDMYVSNITIICPSFQRDCVTYSNHTVESAYGISIYRYR
jgi:hypothetical protein